jgi:hypothetical protein
MSCICYVHWCVSGHGNWIAKHWPLPLPTMTRLRCGERMVMRKVIAEMRVTLPSTVRVPRMLLLSFRREVL